MVGSTLPSHCTSMGRVLLASLAPCETERWLARAALEPRTERTIVSPDALRTELVAVGERRWSLVEEELEVGLRSLAVPVRDREGQVLAALNVPPFPAAHTPEDPNSPVFPDPRAP